MATRTERLPRGRARGFAAAIVAGFLSVGASGCGQAQVGADHRELVLRLATGASTRDRAIIDRAAADIDGLAADRALVDDEAKAFRAILDAARGDDWDRAQSLAYALRDGQHPTDADRERIAGRPLPKMKKPPGTRRPG